MPKLTMDASGCALLLRSMPKLTMGASGCALLL